MQHLNENAVRLPALKWPSLSFSCFHKSVCQAGAGGESRAAQPARSDSYKPGSHCCPCHPAATRLSSPVATPAQMRLPAPFLCKKRKHRLRNRVNLWAAAIPDHLYNVGDGKGGEVLGALLSHFNFKCVTGCFDICITET